MVDDEPAVRLMLARLLGDICMPLTAASAEEALRVLETIKPDLMILDQRMPSMSGEELVEKLSAAGLMPTTILITGFIKDVKDHLRRRVRQVFAKPFDVDGFLEAVREDLGLKDHQPTGEASQPCPSSDATA